MGRRGEEGIRRQKRVRGQVERNGDYSSGTGATGTQQEHLGHSGVKCCTSWTIGTHRGSSCTAWMTGTRVCTCCITWTTGAHWIYLLYSLDNWDTPGTTGALRGTTGAHPGQMGRSRDNCSEALK